MLKIGKDITQNPEFDRRRDLGLPRHGMSHVHNLCAEYYILRGDQMSERLSKEVEEIIQRKKDRKRLSWHDLYLLELAIVQCLPHERLVHRAHAIRARYREVAGCEQYETYLQTDPPDPATAPEALVRADLQELLRSVYDYHCLSALRQTEQEKISKGVAKLLATFLGFLSGVCVLAYFKADVSVQMLPIAVMFVGALGGLVSMQQRYRGPGDPDSTRTDGIRTSSLGTSWTSLVIPPLAGAVFAFILLLTFYGALISGELFPQFPNTKDLTSEPTPIFARLFTTPLPTGDYAKLFVWSFIAGFAERFVPDALGKLVNHKQVKSV